MKMHLMRAMAFAIAGPWLAGCAAADEGVPDSEVLGEERAALEFRSVDYDDGSVNQCVFDGLSMHCCPGNAPTETRWVMIGAHLDLNVFKCAELEPPTYAPPFVDRFTTREGMRACPPNSAMVGFHRDADELACIPLYRAMSESVDYGTQDDFEMHVCPFGQVMSGINDTENQFLCAE